MTDSRSDERREIELSRARLAAIVDSSDDVIVSKTLDGVITTWTRGAEPRFGWTGARGEEGEGVGRLRRGERVDHFETIRVAKDGQLRAVSITVSPVRDADGRIVGASKIARDISERRRLEEERA